MSARQESIIHGKGQPSDEIEKENMRMTMCIAMDNIFAHSKEVVEKEIEGLLIIIPLRGGIEDKENHLALNDAGRAIWDAVDGRKTVNEVLCALADEFMAAPGEIEKDVFSTMDELLKRKMLIESKAA
jgi:hypothetical protein